MPVMTSAASASWGMAFGLTKDVASITGKPDALSRLINWTLSAVSTTPCSFCRPSRGPTSTTVTRRGRSVRGSVGMAIPHSRHGDDGNYHRGNTEGGWKGEERAPWRGRMVVEGDGGDVGAGA